MLKSDEKISNTVKTIVKWLVNKQYDHLEKYSNGIILSSNLIKRAISDYGHELSMPPEAAFRSLDVISIEGQKPAKWSVRCELWTIDEGRSDLTLELTLIDGKSEMLAVEVDDIHVL